MLALGDPWGFHTADDRSPIRHRQSELRRRSGSALGVSDGEVEVKEPRLNGLSSEIQNFVGDLQATSGLPEIPQRRSASGDHRLNLQFIALLRFRMSDGFNQGRQSRLIGQADRGKILHPTVRVGERRRWGEAVVEES